MTFTSETSLQLVLIVAIALIASGATNLFMFFG